MAKRQEIIKFFDYAYKQLKDQYSEHGQVELNDFELGVLYGMDTAKFLIETKQDKKHDF